MIKTYNETEIKKIRTACEVAAECLALLKNSVQPGMTTEELDMIAMNFLSERRVRPAFLGYRGYPKALCVSINEEVVHGIPSKNRVIRSGDIVSLDIGTEIDGYYGDTATTVPVGNVDNSIKELIATGSFSLEQAIEKAAAGNRLYDVSSAVQEIAEKKGYSVVREFVGHGIGSKLHEEPQIPNFGTPGTGPILEEGMVFAIEPMVNMGTFKIEVLEDNWTAVTMDGKPSVHFEHTVVVRKNKGEILTWPKKRD
ncbi:MAG: type I methionyl aminopeptidase [Candidatus Aureabacteria bacterium]|nr:type I methionyl aminopeptidase [Candidatus Auribacterota bacterium]